MKKEGEGDRFNRREMGGEGKAELTREEPEERVAPGETRRWGIRAKGGRNAEMSPELEEVPGKRKDQEVKGKQEGGEEEKNQGQIEKIGNFLPTCLSSLKVTSLCI